MPYDQPFGMYPIITLAENERESAEAIWNRLVNERQPYVFRGWEYAKMTSPSLFPPIGRNQSWTPDEPWQSEGIAMLNTISSKVALAIFPPNVVHVRLVVDPEKSDQIGAKAAQQSGDPTMGDIGANIEREQEEVLAPYERKIHQLVESTLLRPEYEMALKLALLTGTALLKYEAQDKRWRVFPLDAFVLQLDGSKNIIRIVTLERIAWSALPAEARTAIYNCDRWKNRRGTEMDPNEQFYFYTAVSRVPDDDESEYAGEYKVWQECEGERVGEVKYFNSRELPFVPVGYRWDPGSSYARGRVEEQYGTLATMEGLRTLIVEGMAGMLRTVVLVKPGGAADIRQLEKVRNWGYASGNEGDVHVVTAAGKTTEFRAAFEAWVDTRDNFRRDNMRFQPRDSERTSAEEIRREGQEIDSTMGGFWTAQTHGPQRRCIEILVENEIDSEALKKALNADAIHLRILTGLEALGRNAELERYLQWSGAMIQTVGLQAFLNMVDLREHASKLADGAGVDIRGIVFNRAKIKAAEQQAFQAQLAQQMARPLAASAGKMAEATHQAMLPQPNQPQPAAA